MLELALQVATLLGGLSATWFLVDQVRLRKQSRSHGDAARLGRSHTRRRRGLLARTIPVPFAASALWAIAVYFLTENSWLMGVIGVLTPLWILPLAYVIVHQLTRDPALTRLAGGFIGGFVGASVGSQMGEWATKEGLIVGIFFCSLSTGYLAEPQKKMSVVSLIILAVALLAGLGVFNNPSFYFQLDGRSFEMATFALFFAVWGALGWRVFRRTSSVSSEQGAP